MTPRLLRSVVAALLLAVVATSCRTPAPPPVNRTPTGAVAAVRTPAGVEVRGHAHDPDSPATPVEVRVSLNGTVRATGVADVATGSRSDAVSIAVGDLSGIDSLLLVVCLDAKDNERGGFTPVGCELVAGTRIVTNGAIGSIVDRTTGLYWVHGVAVDPNRDGPVPMRLRSLAAGEEVDSVAFLADRDTTGTENPLVTLVLGSMPEYGPLHGFDATGLLDVTGADAIELDAQRVDGGWEQVAHY